MTMRSIHIVTGAVIARRSRCRHSRRRRPKGDKPAAAAARAGAPPAKKPDLPTPPPNFEYAPQGRRDPFVSLLNRGDDGTGSDGKATAKRAEGVPGMLTGELTVRGIVQTRGAWVAMVAGPDGKVYTVRAGDKLARRRHSAR